MSKNQDSTTKNTEFSTANFANSTNFAQQKNTEKNITNSANNENLAPKNTVVAEVDFAISGMTCASCVARVEKKLNKIDGVKAVVNLATEKAHLEISTPAAHLSDETLIQVVEKAGYGANLLQRIKINADGSRQAENNANFEKIEKIAKELNTARTRDLYKKFWISLAISTPIVALSMIPSMQFAGWQWLIGILSLPLGFWCAMPFHRTAFRAARHGSTTMDTLVSLGVLASLGWSYWALFCGGAGKIGYTMQMSGIHRINTVNESIQNASHLTTPHIYFESAAMIITFLLLGRWLEARSRRNAGSALRALLELAPDHTYLVKNPDGTPAERKISVKELTVGAIFRVNPGEKIATDGVVVEGNSSIDTALLTGESVPVEVSPRDIVTGATINTSGSLLVRATRVGEDTQLAQMGRLLTQAQTGKADVQRLADKISSIFVPSVIIISLATFTTWIIISGSFESALIAAITVLVVACPCALGLATPTALLVGSGAAARQGILISGPEVLERAHKIDTVVLDKTGTLTSGEMQVCKIQMISPENFQPDFQDDFTLTDALQIASALEMHSAHPIADAIVKYANNSATENLKLANPKLPELSEIKSGSGLGVSATLRMAKNTENEPNTANTPAIPVAIGNIDWLSGIISADLTTAREIAEKINVELGATAVILAINNQPVCVIGVKDTLRKETHPLLQKLKSQHITPIMISGDSPIIAEAVGKELGIKAEGGIRPEGKVEVVQTLQKEGKYVAMVGDGVNDAPALAAANLSIAIGSGTDVAKAAADITILAGLPAIINAISISRRTLKIIRENLAWAFGYNIIAIPLAAFGIIIPGIAAAAMASSSVIVVANSLRLYQSTKSR